MVRTSRGNVFRDLLLFEHRLDLWEATGFVDDDDRSSYLHARRLFSDIEKALYSYNWTQSKNLILRIDTYLSLDCDFKLFKEAIKTREGDSVSIGALETSIWRASTLFKEMIGVSTVDLLKELRLKEAETQLYVCIGKLSLKNITSDVVMSFMPESSKNVGIDLSTCRNELKILKGLTKSNLEDIFGRLDKDKLAYIRYILEVSDTTVAKERAVLYDFLEGGKYTLDELLLILRSIKLGVE